MPPAILDDPSFSTDSTEDWGAEWRRATRTVVLFQPSLHAELDQLAALRPNWDGYGAPRLDRAIIDAARRFVDRLPEDVSRRPTIVPMSPGNLQFEWHEGQRVLELEFETADTIHYLKWDPAEKVEDENTFPVADAGQAEELIRWFTKSR
ncbi:MAG: hypothetical protein WD066_07185 [Planctomycetaceae bacterium]